jgi:hypothetical protein
MKPNLDSDLPGEYIEFDMSVVSWMRSKFIENTTPAEEARNYVASAKIANERRKEALKMDMAARYGDVNKYITKRMQDVSDVEVKDYLRRMSAGSR